MEEEGEFEASTGYKFSKNRQEQKLQTYNISIHYKDQKRKKGGLWKDSQEKMRKLQEVLLCESVM